MGFEIKTKQKKDEGITKSVYMKRALADEIEKIAKENNTTFSNVVVSMIESCLKDE